MTIKTKYSIGDRVQVNRTEEIYKVCKCCGVSSRDGDKDILEIGTIETINITKDDFHYGIRFEIGRSLFGIKEDAILGKKI